MGRLLLTAIMLFWIHENCKCLEIKIGSLFNEGGCCDFRNIEDKAGAITIALDQLVRDGVWDRNNTLRYFHFLCCWTEVLQSISKENNIAKHVHLRSSDV